MRKGGAGDIRKHDTDQLMWATWRHDGDDVKGGSLTKRRCENLRFMWATST